LVKIIGFTNYAHMHANNKLRIKGNNKFQFKSEFIN